MYRIRITDNSVLYNKVDTGNSSTGEETIKIFRYFVNAIIPRTPGLAYEFGYIQYFGAVDSHMEDYVIQILGDSYFPLTLETAEMLYLVTELLLAADVYIPGTPPYYSDSWMIDTVYTPYNQYFIFNIQHFNLSSLPHPFKDNPVLVISSINSLVNSTIMGYYSEWSGYGTTRLDSPNQQILEYHPFSWEQVGYPGPSMGYHAFRNYSFD